MEWDGGDAWENDFACQQIFILVRVWILKVYKNVAG